MRPDRSASLAREKGGRLDRMDLWILIVMVIAAMCLRTYRLAEPARMHFDEVYHARTATEFLQDWRYGISHDIYEWTHPHFAKYMMAAGIVAFAGHDVAAQSDLGVDVRDAAIEPRYPDAASTTARDGDRVWVATGTELIAYDLQLRSIEARWPLPGASTVTYDDTAHVVYVGTDAGAVDSIDATALDLLRQGQGALPDLTPCRDARRCARPARGLGQRRSPGGEVRRRHRGDGGRAVGRRRSARCGSPAPRTWRRWATATRSPPRSRTSPTRPRRPRPSPGSPAATPRRTRQALERTDVDSVVLDVALTADLRTKLQTAIDGGQLPGITIGKAPQLAVADRAGPRHALRQTARWPATWTSPAGRSASPA